MKASHGCLAVLSLTLFAFHLETFGNLLLGLKTILLFFRLLIGDLLAGLLLLPGIGGLSLYRTASYLEIYRKLVFFLVGDEDECTGVGIEDFEL